MILEFTERRAKIQEMLQAISASLLDKQYSTIDYENIARTISREVGVPVVVFAAPSDSGHVWKLVAYEVPEI